MTDRYKRIREALAMGPTPGPWSIRETETHVTVIGADNEVLFHDDKRIPRVIADARLIAACGPDTSRALLAERDQLAAENEALRAEVERLKNALKGIRSLSSIDSAMIPSPLALTVLLGNMHHIADAALTKENSND